MTTEDPTNRLIDLDVWVMPNVAMKKLGVSHAWLRKLRDSGAIEARKTGFAWLYFVPSLDAYAKERATKLAAKGSSHDD